MPKRKSLNPPASLGSLDAALDLLVCESFTRLESVVARWESAADVKLNPGVVQQRWEEAAKRYWVMKSMDELCCSAGASTSKDPGGEVDMTNRGQSPVVASGREVTDRLNGKVHPGASEVHKLCPEEEDEWRRWRPKENDVVLVELEDGSTWPGKIINKHAFFTGRTVPRGSHFFPVRVYTETIEPTITVKSRLLPFHMRPDPPLLASPSLISAYHHAANPASFDAAASVREAKAGQDRVHPPIMDEAAQRMLKQQKDDWNKVVNWVMNERRGEKLRHTTEEREKRLRAVSQAKEDPVETLPDDFCPKKRRTVCLPDASPSGSASNSRSTSPASSIFGPIVTPQNNLRREGTPAVNHIRPRLSTPPRPNSPRRDRRRHGVFTGLGESSPQAMHTWTPPRILPSGDETAFIGQSAPSRAFDFVSPLGPVSRGKLMNGDGNRRGSLEVVKEEADEEDGWTVVTKRLREKRAGSVPLAMGVLVDGMDQS